MKRLLARLWLCIGVLLCLELEACKEDPAESGGLVIVVETDLAIPQDLDQVDLFATRDGTVLLEKHFTLGNGANGALRLPTRVELSAARANGAAVTIQAIGRKAGHARIVRDAVTPIPSTRRALHISLGWLCDNTALEAQPGRVVSTCPDSLTCVDGTCATPIVPTEDLKPADGSGGAAGSTSGGGGGGGVVDDDTCFNAHSCFANATEVPLETSDCSIATPAGATASTLNLALREKPSATSTASCSGGCLTVLEADGSQGWNPTGGALGARIKLSGGVCAALARGKSFAVVATLGCATKTPEQAQCAAAPNTTPTTPTTPGEIGRTCEGVAQESCGLQCGTRQRTCTNGVWSEWGACVDEGPCAPGSTEACGTQGSRACNGKCLWDECLGQKCAADEPSSQACGKCGTQTRTCDNGNWSGWSSCQNEKPCTPNQVESCTTAQGATGTRSCGGNCEWSGCGTFTCAGESTQACGKCGTRTRTCNSVNGTWSSWSNCEDEGACTPNTTRSCGPNGSQTCNGQCQWGTCGAQSCTGNGGTVIAHGAEETEACGTRCGTRKRLCSNYTFGPWSACSNEGVCTPNTTTTCTGGTQTCTGVCAWGACEALKEITLLRVLDVYANVVGTNVYLTLPAGTPATSLAPDYLYVSAGATVSPSPTTPVNFTQPVTYVVTGSDGLTKTFTVTTTFGSTLAITSFVVNGYTATIIPANPPSIGKVGLYLPNGVSSASLGTPTITHNAHQVVLDPPDPRASARAIASDGSYRYWWLDIGHRVTTVFSGHYPDSIYLRKNGLHGGQGYGIGIVVVEPGVEFPWPAIETGMTVSFDVTPKPGETCTTTPTSATIDVEDVSINVTCN